MARKRSIGPSKLQRQILLFIARHQELQGYPPTVREIMDEFEFSSPSVVSYHLNRLQDFGYLAKKEGKSRGLHLLKMPAGTPLPSGAGRWDMGGSDSHRELAPGGWKANTLTIQMLGTIIAGQPIPGPSPDFSPFGPEDYIEVQADLLPKSSVRAGNMYALRVSGTSMIDALVNDGDVIVLQPVNEVRNGDMVAVWLSDRDEVTLKYIFYENDQVRLQPANPEMKPIMIGDPSLVEVHGKVLLVIRQVR